ncbi:L,D-transpeptidase [Halobacillus litoralis]|uniref:L,D-transpeptidase n=1 Tax=Halobacillus litoralis TaxID=45668 RepID=A0A410MHS7_9BACI|nr:L,D-transpeptidase [Halobacillus litoralis]QAS54261.1 L,D-transpeptidase [Halobacillus litoralis]
MKIIAFVLFLVSPLLPPNVNGEPVIVVNKATHEVVLFSDGEEVFKAPAAIGKTKELTPEGRFHIKVKAKDPYYRKKNIPGGDPDNPLGSRWIGFDALGTDGRIYGIHGTNRPESIGKSVSAGCIRLNNEDVEKLYELVPVEMDVIIVDSDEELKTIYQVWEKEKLDRMLNPAT